MKSVSAREANQGFSRILAAAENGEEVVITRRGKPVARLCPIRETGKDEARAEAVRRMVEMMRKGLPFHGTRVDRDEIYDRCR